ncbi:DgyrCDS14691 [Dimorphilus gyrociliatus]|uniref:DgyrCDS14691 n=1 Tax=Dimorphilus gyrociliatus TaxID=2664684 RepID=A0A7I8WEJ7_9ANNE|nr:DgyrCDS14691 [Dimorphilus gyrociliatus]
MLLTIFIYFFFPSGITTQNPLEDCKHMSESEVSNGVSEYYNLGYYSGGYTPNTVECERLSSPKTNPYFLVKVIATDMEESPGCLDDVAAIYNGSTGNLVRKWCGHMANFSFEISGSHDIFFYFKADSDSHVGRGTKFEIIVPQSRLQQTESSGINLPIILGGGIGGFAGFIGFACMIWCICKWCCL